MTPWSRGPLLLLRRPGVVLALVAAGLVATLPAAASPLFLDSARHATLHRQIADACQWSTGGQLVGSVTFDRAGTQVFEQRVATLAARPSVRLAPPVESLTARAVVRGAAVTLVYRDDFAGHVVVRDGSPDQPGLWLSHRYAEFLGVRAGDRLTVNQQANAFVPANGATSTLPVAVIYTDLRDEPDDPYWCDMRAVYGIVQENALGDPPPPFVLADRATYLGLAGTLRFTAEQRASYRLLDPYPTIPGAEAAAAEFDAAGAAVDDAAWAAGRGRARVQMTGFVQRANLVRDTLGAPVWAISGAGILVGLLVVTAAAVLWTRRRHQELATLAAHGVSARGLGLKAVTEALPAIVAGVVAGGAVAWWLVRLVGPSAVLGPGAPQRAVLAVAVLGVVALLAVGVTAGVRCRALTDVAPRRRLRRYLPWELVPLAAVALLWTRLGDARVATGDNFTGIVATVPTRLLVVPILAVVAVAGLLSRMWARWLRSRRPAPSRPARFLAWRRLGRDAVVTALVAAAAAVPIALAVYGAVVNGSVRATLYDEARAVIGADTVVTLAGPQPVPDALRDHATGVLRLDKAEVAGLTVDLLAVDPDTFARDAYWSGGRSVLDELRTGGVVIGSGPVPTGAYSLRWSELSWPVEVIHVPSLPGAKGGYPVVLVNRAAVPAELASRISAQPQLWISGDAVAARQAVAASRLRVSRVADARSVYAGTFLEPVTYTFAYLSAVSAFTGVIVVVGLLLHLESRTAVHRRAYVLLRRMGLRGRAHLWALLGELGVPLVAGLVCGLALAAGITTALGREFEVNPGIPPPTVIVVPYPVIAGIAVAVAVVAVVAVGFAHARVRRADAASVLRDAA